MAKSIMDYIFKWLAIKFLSRDSQEEAGVIKRDEPLPTAAPNVTKPTPKDVSFIDTVASSINAPAQPIGFVMPPRDADGPAIKGAPPIRFQQDAPSCSDCGSIMVRNGACYKCLNCGSTSGCS
jgi:ribonucleoside-diphosphate reductase alpha chain